MNIKFQDIINFNINSQRLTKGELPLNQFYEMCEAVLDYKQYLEKQNQKEQRLSRNGVDSSESKCETPTAKN